MGGPIAFRTAAAMPDRVGAVASFHGGGLVTDQPNSPHLQAVEDEGAVPDRDRGERRCSGRRTTKTVLKETFAKANLPAEIEVYAGAAHGWCPPDSRCLQRAAGREGVEPLARAVREGAGVKNRATPARPHAANILFPGWALRETGALTRRRRPVSIYTRMSIDMQLAATLRRRAASIRRTSLQMVHRARLGHPGGDLSAADILAVLYFACLAGRSTGAATARP